MRVKGAYKIIFPIVAGLLIIPVAYFIFAPLHYITLNQIFVHKLTNLSNARNYYTVVSVALNAYIGVIGICLGYFYFFHKKEIDNYKNEADISRTKINLIIDQINKYDEYVDELLAKRFDDAKRLNFLRSKIVRGPEIINALLIHNDKLLLGFGEKDITVIMQVFSFVEKSEEIHIYNYEKLMLGELKYIQAEYIDKIQEARKVCYLKT